MKAAAQTPNQLGDENDIFDIVATVSLHERRPRTLKHNDTFAVFDSRGDVIAGDGNSEGVYHHDTRHLSHFYLTMCGGTRPILLSSSLRDDNSALNCDLSNPDLILEASGEELPNDRIHIRRTRFVCDDRIYERLTVSNYDDLKREITLELSFACDFADLFEVRGATRIRRGAMLPPEVGSDNVMLAYEGLDRRTRSTTLSFAPVPELLSERLATFRFSLEPRKSATVTIEIACETFDSAEPKQTHAQAEPIRHRLVRSYRQARSDLRTSSARAASITSSNDVFNQSVRRCIADTYMLLTQTDFGPFPYAGIPWYSTVFGRDALITALETVWIDPEIARGVLTYLAHNQATDFNAEADAEPGKILHELRHGEMANLGEVPFRRYYGSIDSTPLFVMLAGAYLERTADIKTIMQLWPNLERALAWIEDHGDRDGDGYVEYGRQTADGLVNQGWKDSHDSIFHEDGSSARGPIALAEVQAYVYGAWHAAATILTKAGRTGEAAVYRERANGLAERFDRDFFDEELGTYVLALDGDKKPCRVRSSNAGQVLFTGLAYPERAASVVKSLMSRESFSGWGIRTITAGEARYNPMSYHNGSIWPHDNALIAAGMARYGFREETARIFDALFAASTYVDLRRLPELFCGFSRRPADGPTFYPVSCISQAWSAAAPLLLLQSCLGLTIDAENEGLEFDRPMLPPFLDELQLGRLTVADGCVDLSFHRSGTKVLVEVVKRDGDVTITTCV